MRERTHDVIVLGAGPAGVAAAVTAAAAGLSVALIEEAATAGGQVYRAPAPGLRPSRLDRDADRIAGDALRQELAESTVDVYLGHRAWSVIGRYRVEAVGPRGTMSFRSPALIAATGAHERVVPFPGWTLPGVIGLAAATILLKAQAMLPGGRVVLAGCGPLLAAAAAKVVKAGGEVVAIVDMASRADWLKALPDLASRPRLLMRGAGWLMRIQRSATPVLASHGIRRAEGDGRFERVVIGPVDGDGRPLEGSEETLEADCLAVGHGLVPGCEVPRLLGAECGYDALHGGWVPVLDEDGRTSMTGLYAAGDGAGLRGALPAEIMGRLAGLAVARDERGYLTEAHEGERARLLAALQRASAFADRMARMMALRRGQVAAIAPDTIVCRCEDVSRGDIDAAIAEGARDINQLKHFTRCGMGPCQGRMCGDVVGELAARRLGVERARVGFWTQRPPLRPVALDELVGDYTYDDIPIPPPAPL